MKELNIIEASNMPVGTEFNAITPTDRRCRCSITETDGTVPGVKLMSLDIVESCSEFINAKFIPIQKSVSFMDVVANSDKKKVKVAIGDICRLDNYITETLQNYMQLDEIFQFLGDNLYSYKIKEIIEKGKWYIED